MDFFSKFGIRVSRARTPRSLAALGWSFDFVDLALPIGVLSLLGFVSGVLNVIFSDDCVDYDRIFFAVSPRLPLRRHDIKIAILDHWDSFVDFLVASGVATIIGLMMAFILYSLRKKQRSERGRKHSCSRVSIFLGAVAVLGLSASVVLASLILVIFGIIDVSFAFMKPVALILNLGFSRATRIDAQCEVDVYFPAISAFVSTQFLVTWLFSRLKCDPSSDAHSPLPHRTKTRLCMASVFFLGYIKVACEIFLQKNLYSKFRESRSSTSLIHGIVFLSTLQIGLAVASVVPALVTIAQAPQSSPERLKERVRYIQTLSIRTIDVVELGLVIALRCKGQLEIIGISSETRAAVNLVLAADLIGFILALTGVTLELPMMLMGVGGSWKPFDQLFSLLGMSSFIFEKELAAESPATNRDGGTREEDPIAIVPAPVIRPEPTAPVVAFRPHQIESFIKNRRNNVPRDISQSPLNFRPEQVERNVLEMRQTQRAVPPLHRGIPEEYAGREVDAQLGWEHALNGEPLGQRWVMSFRDLDSEAGTDDVFAGLAQWSFSDRGSSCDEHSDTEQGFC